MMLYSIALCLMMSALPMGIMAMSKCPDHCPRIYNPVCGDNGKDYFNECLVRMDACKRHVEIRVAFKGVCADEGKADCNKRCPMSFQSVCGSDGETYPSKCFMEVIACKSRKEITMVHEGECGEEEEKKEECNAACPRIIRPVCGSDGETYLNSCILKVAACKSKTEITVVHLGECKPEVEEVDCNFARSSMKYKPVCGSNGETYDNVCLLKAAACHYDLHLAVVREGECRDEDLPCPKIYEPVCGSNGETYNSECMLNFVSTHCDCQNKITLAHEGECKIKRENDCYFSRELNYKPVCGNDGNTYFNECLLKANRCMTHTDIRVVNQGRCPI